MPPWVVAGKRWLRLLVDSWFLGSSSFRAIELKLLLVVAGAVSRAYLIKAKGKRQKARGKRQEAKGNLGH